MDKSTNPATPTENSKDILSTNKTPPRLAARRRHEQVTPFPGVIKRVKTSPTPAKLPTVSEPINSQQCEQTFVTNGHHNNLHSQDNLEDSVSLGGSEALTAQSVDEGHMALTTPPTDSTLSDVPTQRPSRLVKLHRLLAEPIVDLDQVAALSWHGIPPEDRPTVWRLLLGYMPTNQDRREATLQRKRREYLDSIPQYFEVKFEDRTEDEQAMLKQIQMDVIRTNPRVPLFQDREVQKRLVRILYIWALRHPASGYVQGINDLVTPFFVVFLGEHVATASAGGQLHPLRHVEEAEVTRVPPERLDEVEADTYWCVTKLLDFIQDHYTVSQPGIQRMVYKLAELIHKIDPPLYEHLQDQGAQFLQFSFRWMNCLLLRELPLHLIIRMWDTYLSEEAGPAESFRTFHVYVCAAFLVSWSKRLQQLEFQDLMLFLQNLPTFAEWDEKDVQVLLAQAFMYKSLYHSSPMHLKS